MYFMFLYMTDNFPYQPIQLINTDNITLWDQRKNVQITDEYWIMLWYGLYHEKTRNLLH